MTQTMGAGSLHWIGGVGRLDENLLCLLYDFFARFRILVAAGAALQSGLSPRDISTNVQNDNEKL